MPVYFSTGQVVKYEAEDGTLSGSLNIQKTYPTYTGTGYVTGFAKSSDNIHLNITQNLHGEGWHIVKIRYANPLHNANTMSLYVNGRKSKIIRLSQNNDDNDAAHNWTNYSCILYFKNGTSNAIDLQCDRGDDGRGVNIDYLEVATETTYDDGKSIAPSATATASSGIASNAIDGCAQDSAHEWSASGTTGEWIRLDWTSAQAIDKIRLYNKMGGNNQVLSGTLSFSDGTTVPVGKLQGDGEAGCVVTFPPKTVTWVKFTVNTVKRGTSSSGLGAFEVYEVHAQ
jgi:hypothetical protein